MSTEREDKDKYVPNTRSQDKATKFLRKLDKDKKQQDSQRADIGLDYSGAEQKLAKV